MFYYFPWLFILWNVLKLHSYSIFAKSLINNSPSLLFKPLILTKTSLLPPWTHTCLDYASGCTSLLLQIVLPGRQYADLSFPKWWTCRLHMLEHFARGLGQRSDPSTFDKLRQHFSGQRAWFCSNNWQPWPQRLFYSRPSGAYEFDYTPRTRLGIVNQGIYAREWVGILGTSLVQINKVDTHPPLPISLLNQHNICHPLKVLDLPYVASIQELLSLFSDDEMLIYIEFSSPLNHRFDLFIYGKPTSHLFLYLSKASGFIFKFLGNFFL